MGVLSNKLMPYLVLAGFNSSIAISYERYLPGPTHLRAVEIASDCRVYRHLKSKTEEKILHYQTLIREGTTLLRDKRRELQICAAKQGVTYRGDEESEQLLYQVCPDAYDAWMSPGISMLSIQQDLDENRLTQDQLDQLIRVYCRPGLPSLTPASYRRGKLKKTQRRDRLGFQMR